jgi:hypothetical protein
LSLFSLEGFVPMNSSSRDFLSKLPELRAYSCNDFFLRAQVFWKLSAEARLYITSHSNLGTNSPIESRWILKGNFAMA